MLKKTVLTGFVVLACAQFAFAGFSLNGMLDAGNDAVKAATLSDAQIKSEAGQARAYMDKANKIAPPSSPYAKRLAKITKGMKTEGTQRLDIKVYLVKDVNAFAMADGTVRVFSGLMDKMTDDEIRYVLGHEVGHVNLGHSKQKVQMAHAAVVARKVGAASTSNTVSTLSNSVVGDFAEKLVNAQFSQAEESEADKYALKVMKTNKYDTKAAASALRKLEKLFGNDRSVFSSHPAPGDRADEIEKML